MHAHTTLEYFVEIYFQLYNYVVDLTPIDLTRFLYSLKFAKVRVYSYIFVVIYFQTSPHQQAQHQTHRKLPSLRRTTTTTTMTSSASTGPSS